MKSNFSYRNNWKRNRSLNIGLDIFDSAMPGRQLSVALSEGFSIFSPGAGRAINVRIAVIQQFSRFIRFLGTTGWEAASIVHRLGGGLPGSSLPMTSASRHLLNWQKSCAGSRIGCRAADRRRACRTHRARQAPCGSNRDAGH